ncbi:hypothetical protein H5P28_05530 [Ruficoccus amylovorans]|uniref:Predicted 3'-5' exonuclease PolB-like domain-containing protein n=1 Tax=Ruficoccus amylovorans TaxID=1804625 RepID=A0A842HC15_9BACT|nr:hypothetical protein [Ruficoccus amylovorans]MBC2593719.1 hypothetical protein [Ruficoccus amylovorans]
MFKYVHPTIFSFDVEWIPDPKAAQMLYGVAYDPPHNTHDAFRKIWAESGATPENPRPWVKTALCRIVSICGIFREAGAAGGVSLKLVSMPADTSDPAKCAEPRILEMFLKAVGGSKPQLVGFNSVNADVPIIVQRAIIHGLDSHGFAKRPEKPWEGIDYFSNAGDFHVDLAHGLARGVNTPRLHEIATLSGIPGKIDAAGDQVWDLYLRGHVDQIVDYNECDAFTTHLLWARMAHFAGLLDKKAYETEQRAVRELLEECASQGKDHLRTYLHKWDELQEMMRGQYPNS